MTLPPEPDALPHEECIAKLQQEFWNSPPLQTCPVCGKQHVEREKSALELWERFLSAGPAGEKDWHRRTLGRLLQLVNYILIAVATSTAITVGMYAIFLMFERLLQTAAWWLSALVALIVFVFIHDWCKRIRAK
jgi:hypothetical protein